MLRYATSYYGSQSKETMSVVTQFVEQTGKYVDITSGGSSYPYQLLYNGLQVGVNDRCYYSYLNSKVVFTKSSCVVDEQILDINNRKDGYLSSLLMEKYFSSDLAGYIDYVCDSGDELIRALVGRVLVGKFTFRGFGWAKKMVDGSFTNTYTPEQFRKDMLKQAKRIEAFTSQLPDDKCIGVTNMDALQSLNNLDVSDAVVYTDPAWPWIGNMAQNPYKFFTDDVSSILMQKHAPQPVFWDERTDAQIIDEVISWGQSALSHGAKYFILSTQSTNRPSPPHMYDIINKTLHLHQYIVKDAWSFGSHKNFGEYFGVYTL